MRCQEGSSQEKGPRWKITDSQLAELRESYAREAYPTRKVKEAFAAQFGCTYDWVKRWFDRQR